MTIYTSIAVVLGLLVGCGCGYYYCKRKIKLAVEKAIKENNSKGFHTLKSEGDDQPNKEAELQIGGKEDVLGQPAASSSIPKKKKRKKKKPQKEKQPEPVEELEPIEESIEESIEDSTEEPTEPIDEEIKEVVELNQ